MRANSFYIQKIENSCNLGPLFIGKSFIYLDKKMLQCLTRPPILVRGYYSSFKIAIRTDTHICSESPNQAKQISNREHKALGRFHYEFILLICRVQLLRKHFIITILIINILICIIIYLNVAVNPRITNVYNLKVKKKTMIIRASLTTQINVHQQVVFFLCISDVHENCCQNKNKFTYKENTHSFTPNNIASCFHAERSFDEC